MNENDKLDRVIEKLSDLGAHFAKMDEKVEWMAKGLDANNKKYELLEKVTNKKFEMQEKKIQAALLPIKAAKFIAAAATGATAIVVFLKAVGSL